MVRYLTLAEVMSLHQRVVAQAGGADGLRDLGALEAAVAQPKAAFSGQALYPTLLAKAAALGHALVANHPFVDGNKRVGHAAIAVFLGLNGFRLDASLDDSETFVLALAAGEVSREELTNWLSEHTKPL